MRLERFTRTGRRTDVFVVLLVVALSLLFQLTRREIGRLPADAQPTG
jgi:hypothetical protein